MANREIVNAQHKDISMELTEYARSIGSGTITSDPSVKANCKARKWSPKRALNFRLRGARERNPKPKVKWEAHGLQGIIANMKEARKPRSTVQESIWGASSISRESSDESSSSRLSSEGTKLSSPSCRTYHSNGLEMCSKEDCQSMESVNDLVTDDEQQSIDSPVGSPNSVASTVETWPPRMIRQKPLMIPSESPRVLFSLSSEGGELEEEESNGGSFLQVALGNAEETSSRVMRFVSRKRGGGSYSSGDQHMEDDSRVAKTWKPKPRHRWGLLIPGGSSKKRIDAVAVGMLNDSFITYQTGVRNARFE